MSAFSSMKMRAFEEEEWKFTLAALRFPLPQCCCKTLQTRGSAQTVSEDRPPSHPLQNCTW